MFTSVLLSLTAAALGAAALSLPRNNLQCSISCPTTDTEGNVFWGGGVTGTTLDCNWGYQGPPNYTVATSCWYDSTTGAYQYGYGGCPPSALVTYSCPSVDSAGNAFWGGATVGDIFTCNYGYSGAPNYTVETACNYDVATGAFVAGYGACPDPTC